MKDRMCLYLLGGQEPEDRLRARQNIGHICFINDVFLELNKLS